MSPPFACPLGVLGSASLRTKPSPVPSPNPVLSEPSSWDFGRLKISPNSHFRRPKCPIQDRDQQLKTILLPYEPQNARIAHSCCRNVEANARSFRSEFDVHRIRRERIERRHRWRHLLPHVVLQTPPMIDSPLVARTGLPHDRRDRARSGPRPRCPPPWRCGAEVRCVARSLKCTLWNGALGWAAIVRRSSRQRILTWQIREPDGGSVSRPRRGSAEVWWPSGSGRGLSEAVSSSDTRWQASGWRREPLRARPVVDECRLAVKFVRGGRGKPGRARR